MSKVISTTVLNPNGKEDTCAYAVIDSKELYCLLSPITVTDRYTISFYIKALANETLKLWYGEDYKEFSVTTSWQKIEWSFSAEHIDNVMLQFTQGNYYIYNTMLERGDVATDYRLSQADQDKILANVEETLNAKYAQLVIALDNITLEVSETNGRVDKAESSIKIMSDNIALKVDKNGVISAINVSKENIKILAKMIDLVGQVTISDLADDVVVKVDDTTLIDGGKIYTDTLFSKDIEMTGAFNAKSQAFINPTSDDIDDISSRINSLSATEIAISDVNKSGGVNIQDIVLLKQLQLGMKSVEDYVNSYGYEPQLSDILVTIDPSNTRKTVRCTAVNKWGTTIDNYFGIDGMHVNLIKADSVSANVIETLAGANLDDVNERLKALEAKLNS